MLLPWLVACGLVDRKDDPVVGGIAPAETGIVVDPEPVPRDTADLAPPPRPTDLDGDWAGLCLFEPPYYGYGPSIAADTTLDLLEVPTGIIVGTATFEIDGLYGTPYPTYATTGDTGAADVSLPAAVIGSRAKLQVALTFQFAPGYPSFFDGEWDDVEDVLQGSFVLGTTANAQCRWDRVQVSRGSSP